MMDLFFATFALSATPGLAQEAPASPQARLDEAIRLYTSGDLQASKATLTDLLNDDAVVDKDLRTRARVYLGEVLYVEGQRAAAWDAFRVIIRDQPDLHLDPYEHPPDVVEFYETVRAATTTLDDRLPQGAQGPVSVPSRPPFPISGVLPLGIYQMRNDHPVRGAVLAVGQVATGTASLALLGSLLSDHDAGSDQARYEELTRRRTVQFACTAGFYSLWIASVVDATATWRRTSATPVSLGIQGDGDEVLVELHWSGPGRKARP